MRPRLLIVDDHDGFRAVARALLEGDGYDVVGEAADGAEAVIATRRLRPAIVLLDIHLPDIDGFAVSHALADLEEPPAVVLISSRPLADIRQRMTHSPVAGFIPKDELTGRAVAALVG
jgi:DNA-binding NarL/FixJ family response regulator